MMNGKGDPPETEETDVQRKPTQNTDQNQKNKQIQQNENLKKRTASRRQTLSARADKKLFCGTLRGDHGGLIKLL